jgi:hypothetical protein
MAICKKIENRVIKIIIPLIINSQLGRIQKLGSPDIKQVLADMMFENEKEASIDPRL